MFVQSNGHDNPRKIVGESHFGIMVLLRRRQSLFFFCTPPRNFLKKEQFGCFWSAFDSCISGLPNGCKQDCIRGGFSFCFLFFNCQFSAFVHDKWQAHTIWNLQHFSWHVMMRQQWCDSLQSINQFDFNREFATLSIFGGRPVGMCGKGRTCPDTVAG